MTDIVSHVLKPAPDSQAQPKNLASPRATNFLRTWHRALDSSSADRAEGMHLANRGDRALLRRCRSLDEIRLTPVFYALRQQLAAQNVEVAADYQGDEKLAIILGLAAWVKVNDESQRFSQQLAGRRSGTTDAKLSGLRFRKLLLIEDRQKLYEELIGVIRLLGDTANIKSLAYDLYHWRPDSSCFIRRQWAEDYYSQLPEET